MTADVTTDVTADVTVTVPTSPLVRAFAVTGTERTAIDSLRKLCGYDPFTAHLIVRALRAEEAKPERTNR